MALLSWRSVTIGSGRHARHRWLSMGAAQGITAALGGKWFGVYGVVRCVAHDDGRPSLKLRDGEVGTLLVHCYAGCAPAAILEELRRRDFFGTENVEPRRECAHAALNPELEACKRERRVKAAL